MGVLFKYGRIDSNVVDVQPIVSIAKFKDPLGATTVNLHALATCPFCTLGGLFYV